MIKFFPEMDDKVPFKAYVHWKDQEKPEVRRFGIEKSVVTSFCYLYAKLQDVYSGLKNKSYTVFWKGKLSHFVLDFKNVYLILFGM